MKPQWLERSLVTSPVYYSLATSAEIYFGELKRLKVPTLPGKDKEPDATTNIFENENGETCCIVCLFDHTRDKNQIFALLVHEAVHIWQEIRKSMGENEPSVEFEAYSIQRISQSLFYEYDRQRKRKRK